VTRSAEMPGLLAAWHVLAVLLLSETVEQQRGVRLVLGKGKVLWHSACTAMRGTPGGLPLCRMPPLEAEVQESTGVLFVKYTVCSHSSFGELLVSTWVVHRRLLMERDSRVQLVVTGSVVCRERRASLASVETKEIRENW